MSEPTLASLASERARLWQERAVKAEAELVAVREERDRLREVIEEARHAWPKTISLARFDAALEPAVPHELSDVPGERGACTPDNPCPMHREPAVCATCKGSGIRPSSHPDEDWTCRDCGGA